MRKIEVNAHHICVACSRQFIDVYAAPQDYSDAVKAMCLKMYVNGMGLRGIERVTGVDHTTVIYWVKLVGKDLLDAYEPDSIPEVGELDELETFVGSKTTVSWAAIKGGKLPPFFAFSGLRLLTSNQGS